MIRLRAPLFVIALAVVPGCAAMFAAARGTLKRPNVKVQQVNITGLSRDSLSADVVCEVQNPNDFALDLGSFSYALTVDGHPLLDGKSDHGFKVLSGATQLVTLPIEIKLAEFSGDLGAIFERGELPFTFKTSLGFNTPLGIVSIPVSHSGMLPAPRMPRLAFAGISLESVHRARMRIDVTNANPFPIPLGNFNYQVSIEQREVTGGAVAVPRLAASATQQIEIPITISLLQLGFAAVQAAQAGEIHVRVKGALDLPALHKSLPFDEEHVLPLH